MKIAIDARCLSVKPAGVANYLICAVNELAKPEHNCQVFLLSNNPFISEVKMRLLVTKNMHTLIKPFFFLKSVGVLWYLFKLPYILYRLRPDIVWGPAHVLPLVKPKKTSTLVTIHDFVYKEMKNTMSWKTKLEAYFFINNSIRRADYIWTVSIFTKGKLKEYFPSIKSNKIFVGSGIDTNKFKHLSISESSKDKLLKKFNLPEKFILFVGTIEPRKNIKFLFDLTPGLAKEGFSILIIGLKGWGNVDIIDRKGFPKENIKFSGYITVDDLAALYNIASVFVSPSLYEGFGMPQLEAMTCGCPVVTAHNSALIELVSGVGKTIEDWEETHWIETIKEVYEKREYYSEKAIKKASYYRWDLIIKDFIHFLDI